MYLCRIIYNYSVMKRFYIIIAFIMLGFAQMIGAQNMYRNYQSNNIRKPTSAVSVVHSNGYVYFFQADNSGHLSAAEIDPLSMLPTGVNYLFQISSGYNIHLNGGFETFSGDFVLFGYYDIGSSYSNYLAFVVVKQDLSNCTYYRRDEIGEFTAGCAGRSLTEGDVFLLVSNGMLYEVSASIPSIVYRISLDQTTNFGDRYTDISWDVGQNKFIVTGSARNSPTGHEDPFVQVCDLQTHNLYSTAAYYVCNQQYFHSNVYQSLHTQLDENELILYHDLRIPFDTLTHDIIWLARINQFWDINLATVAENWNYVLPNAKLSAKDMIYDYNNNRLNFLGVFHQCTAGFTQILAQVNPYSLSSGINIGQLGAAFSGGICQNPQYPVVDIHYNDLSMSNLAWNYHNPCFPVLIAGVEDNLISLLTETYDISLSTCDQPMWHNDNTSNCDLKPYSLSPLSIYDPFLPASSSDIKESVIVSKICDELEACSHQYGGKSLNRPLRKSETIAEITIEFNNQFVCEGFEGEIQYYLYDIAGKLLQRGITYNGEQNLLRISNGIYLLKAMDASGSRELKKIVVL